MSNVPKLRFSEFSGEWEEKKLQNISKKIGSGSTPRGGEKVYQDSGIPFIRSQNVNNNRLTLDNITYISEEINQDMNNSIVLPRDILLNITGASIGRSCVVPEAFNEGNVNQHVCIIRLKEDSTPDFIQPLLSSDIGQKLIYQGQTGSGREGINFQSIGSFKLYLPTLPEQQKIASFLTAVDSKIEQLNKKQSLLQAYKKGVMQQIFSQKIRFKADDGSEFPEWEEKKLGNLGTFKGGGTPSTSNKDYWTGDIPWISSSDLIEQDIHKININRFISKTAVKESATKIIPKNSILFVSRVGVGKIAISKSELCTSQDFTNLILINKNSGYFIGYYFLSKKNLLIRYSQGTSIKGFTANDIKALKLNLPSNPEQRKIATFLTSIDTKIDQNNKQLEQTKLFKKALLQQMFV